MITEDLFITNAPEVYDYHYVETIGTLTSVHGDVCRVIEVSDMTRFENFQRPRYGSALYQSFEFDSPEAKASFNPEDLKAFEPKGAWPLPPRRALG